MSHTVSTSTPAMERTHAAWRARLRACAALADSAALLAEAMAELRAALSAAVFLLDYTKQYLICAASSPCPTDISQAQPSISVDILHDPVNFCLKSGQPYHSAVVRESGIFPSSVYLHANALSLEAIPLFAREERLIGVLLLSFGRADSKDAASYALCDYGALIMASIMQKERHASMVHSLESDLALLQQRAHERASRCMIGGSAAMCAVREQIIKAAPSDVHVLLTGETGNGKELAADLIHASSRRSDKVFLKINCGALPANLLESELFGHKKGAFSGATSDHPGLLRSADGGTILLDEIGEMPPELQVKLLRFLQDNIVRPIGDIRHYPLNVRIIAATNVDITQAVASGKVRSDLYHRLAVFHIKLPPLHDRREDIPLLALHFLEKACAAYHRPVLSLSSSVLAALCEHDYPGNVRELAACIERAVLMTEPDAGLLELQNIFPSIKKSGGENLMDYVARYESLLIVNALKHYKGNISEAARKLGIPRRTLGSKMQRLALAPGADAP